MIINHSAINLREMKDACKILNKSKTVPETLDMTLKWSKEALTKAFIKVIEAAYDNGILDNIPEEVYDYYSKIVKEESPIFTPEEQKAREERAQIRLKQRAEYKAKMQERTDKINARKKRVAEEKAKKAKEEAEAKQAVEELQDLEEAEDIEEEVEAKVASPAKTTRGRRRAQKTEEDSEEKPDFESSRPARRGRRVKVETKEAPEITEAPQVGTKKAKRKIMRDNGDTQTPQKQDLDPAQVKEFINQLIDRYSEDHVS